VEARFHHRIEEVDAEAWDRLVRDGNPFLKYAFHAALERHGCVGEHYGWRPSHVAVYQEGRLVGLSPLYFKMNSYGEFVFDHAWADAYRRAGLVYYPKLVCAVPYTPATGERLLIDPQVDRAKVARTLLDATLTLAKTAGISSMHWLFVTERESEELQALGMMERLGVQFHWTNPGYRDFDDFLARLNTKRRKNIRRERNRAIEQGFRFRIVHGPDVTHEEWRLFTDFYVKTFEERFSLPTLNLGFFEEIGKTLGDQVVLILAYQQQDDRCVAGALLYRSHEVLYGRHWGAESQYDSLHFETCYYQGIEYAIAHGLRRFEPGAQGEHKIWRGFLPTLTHSCHWIADRRFKLAIEDFLQRERPSLLNYHAELSASSPYRQIEEK